MMIFCGEDCERLVTSSIVDTTASKVYKNPLGVASTFLSIQQRPSPAGSGGHGSCIDKGYNPLCDFGTVNESLYIKACAVLSCT